jgi:hypothetical protein
MQPSLKQLKEVLGSVTDSKDYVLILNLNATFELVEGAGAGAISHLDYVTRWNTYDKGYGYVGKEASKDDKHTDRIMKWANEAWKTHQETGRTRITNLRD